MEDSRTHQDIPISLFVELFAKPDWLRQTREYTLHEPKHNDHI